MKQLLKRTRALWYATPIELAKGAIKGQFLRVTKPGRYKRAVAVRPDRMALAIEKRQIASLIADRLKAQGIVPVKIFGRVKSLGSIDRKHRFTKIAYPEKTGERLDSYMQEDLIGFTIVTRSIADCYAVVKALRGIGILTHQSVRQSTIW